QTKNKAGFKIPVEITVFEDRSYNFRLKQPPASELLKKAAGIEKGSGTPNKTKVAKITKAQLKEIAQKKMEDLNTADIEKAMKIIEGTAKNMGIEIVP
ncbi:50S ribosomal protein L11, partial [bacterium]|nr:50S ribosomal protein L11 [bacterium]